MKVYDCFPFYNEFELLELRLKALWDVVDYFVLVEADKTHTNKPKPYYFWERQDEFKEFFPKIRHLPVEMTMPYAGVGDWSIENAQRDAIAYGLDDAEPDDLIFISDADEIVAPDLFQRIRDDEVTLTVPKIGLKFADKTAYCAAKLLVPASQYLDFGAIVMNQAFHYYYFDWVSDTPWQGTILTKRKNLTTPQDLRNQIKFLPRADNGGYHFSYMGGVDRVIEKMTSIVEGNFFVERSGGKCIDRAYIEKSMAQGTDIYGRQDVGESQFLSFDAHNIKLPHLDEFLSKYPHFLREPEKYFGADFHG